MKHLTRITQSQPASADAMQDFICFTAQALNSFITIIGGMLPITTFIEDKCALPTPNEPDTETT